MKRCSFFLVALSCCCALLFCSIAAGQQDMTACGRDWNASLSAVEGTIEKVYFAVPPGSIKAGLHLQVRAASGEQVVVHVFPQNCVARNPDQFSFKAGERITALGSPFFTERETRKNICAAIIAHGSASLELRDPDSGRMNYSLCSNCKRTCETACKGKPIMCVQMCMSRCSSQF